MRVDVAGAGIIGLSIAWRLAQAGVTTVVWDAGRAAGAASWAGAGMLTPAGEFAADSPWATRAVESLAVYPAFVAELEAESGVSIDFRVCGTVEIAMTPEEAVALDGPRADGMIVEPLPVSQAVARAPIPRAGIAAARWIPAEAVVNPREVCAALLTACRKWGVIVNENQPMPETHGPAVISSGAWASQHVALNAAPRAFPVKGHLLGYRRPPGSLLPIVRNGHYYALQRANGFTIFGSDEQPGRWDIEPEPDRIAALAQAAKAMLPGLLDGPPEEAWAGLRPCSEAGMPVVGQLPGREIWLAYGHFRNGILLAPTTAETIAAAITSNPGTGSHGPGYSPRSGEPPASGGVITAPEAH